MKIQILALVAKVLGKKLGLTITVGGQQAYATKDSINVPAVEGPDAPILTRGYLDHESGHHRYGDFEIIYTPDFQGRLLNCIEDIRIERNLGMEYPGCMHNLKELTRVLAETHGVFKPDPAHPSTSILAWVQSRSRVKVLGHDSLELTRQSSEPVACMAFGNHFVEAERQLDTIPFLQSEYDSMILRDELMRLLKEAAEDFDKDEQKQQQEEQSSQQQSDDQSDEQSDQQQSDSQSSQNGGKDEEGEQDNQEQSGDKDNQDASDQNGAGQGNDDQKTDSPESGDQAGDGNEQDEGDGMDGSNDQQSSPSDQNSRNGKDDGKGNQVSDKSPGKQVKGAGSGEADPDLVEAALQEALSSENLQGFGDIGEKLETLLGNMAQQQSNQSQHRPILPEATELPPTFPFADLSTLRVHSAKLRACLSGLVQASRLKRSNPTRNGGKVDNRVITRLRVGDDRIFRRKNEKKDVNTAITMVLDLSSSMDVQSKIGSRVYTATRACFVAAEALNAIPGIKVAIAGFSGRS